MTTNHKSKLNSKHFKSQACFITHFCARLDIFHSFLKAAAFSFPLRIRGLRPRARSCRLARRGRSTSGSRDKSCKSPKKVGGEPARVTLHFRKERGRGSTTREIFCEKLEKNIITLQPEIVQNRHLLMKLNPFFIDPGTAVDQVCHS